MITGTKLQLLTKEAILEKITEYDIYRYYCPCSFTLNKPFCSPMPGRSDTTPSFIISTKSGNVSHIDFGDPNYKGDCFSFVQQIRILSQFIDVLRTIDKDFGLGLSNGKAQGSVSIPLTQGYEQPRIIKKPSLIQVVTRKFTDIELAYWNKFAQDRSDLLRENIYSFSQIYYNRKSFYIPDNELRFGYLYGDKWKIYRPYADKADKWKPNNVPFSTFEGQENLTPGCKAVITKSKKDKMVLLKVYPYVAAVQSENIVCFTEETTRWLRENTSEQYLSFDADIPGKKASHEVTAQLGFKHINVPDRYLSEGIKDWAGLAEKYGLDPIIQHFKEKGLL
jgi:hypothetical protein